MMKIAMHDWPPLFAHGCAGLAAALGLATIAVLRGQNLVPSRSLASRLALGAAINVFAWMGFTALALLWLLAAQAALLTFPCRSGRRCSLGRSLGSAPGCEV